jgi:hypothetical protein
MMITEARQQGAVHKQQIIFSQGQLAQNHFLPLVFALK